MKGNLFETQYANAFSCEQDFCPFSLFPDLISIQFLLKMVDELPALLEQYGDDVFELTEQGKVHFYLYFRLIYLSLDPLQADFS